MNYHCIVWSGSLSNVACCITQALMLYTYTVSVCLKFFLYYCTNFYAYLGAVDISKYLKNICIHKQWLLESQDQTERDTIRFDIRNFLIVFAHPQYFDLPQGNALAFHVWASAFNTEKKTTTKSSMFSDDLLALKSCMGIKLVTSSCTPYVSHQHSRMIQRHSNHNQMHPLANQTGRAAGQAGPA